MPSRTAIGVPILLALALAAVAAGEEAATERSSTVHIRGGTFVMGTPEGRIPELKARYGITFPGAFGDEAPAHTVTLSDCRLDRREVSNEEFSRFLEGNPGWRRERLAPELHNGDYLAHWTAGRYPEGEGEHPVVFITWHAAQSFCRWAGGRLPTEAEWEWAARAGDEREFPWGDDPPRPELANYSASDIDATTPGGSYGPNDHGLYDLAGNVWEFLLDVWEPYGADPQTDPIAGGPVADDRIMDVRGRRSVRGGSYGGAIVNLRTRWRDSHVVSNAIGFVGFRCAYPVEQ